jgi:predicted nuclease of predicted toxin-antitoxin system
LKIKVDEDLPKALVETLRESFPDTTSVLEEKMSGIKDPDLWGVVQNEGRFFITSDKAFANTRRYPPGTHHGVLLLRPDEQGIPPLRHLMAKVLDSGRMERLRGCTAVAAPGRLRVRRPKKQDPK